MKRICEQCGAELLDDAKYCTNCGKECKEEKMCPNCNALIKDGAKFCTRCGCNLEKSVKGKRNIGKWIRVLLFVLGVFLLPSIVIPIGVIWGVVALLKKKGIWEKMNKGVKIGGAVGVICVCAVIMIADFSDGSVSKNSMEKEDFKKEFCEKIGVEYNPEEWKYYEDSKSEIYGYNQYIAVYLYLNDKDEVLNVAIVNSLGAIDSLVVTGGWGVDSIENWNDIIFSMKVAAVSVLAQCDMDIADEMVRKANKNEENISTFADYNLVIIPYVKLEEMDANGFQVGYK